MSYATHETLKHFLDSVKTSRKTFPEITPPDSMVGVAIEHICMMGNKFPLDNSHISFAQNHIGIEIRQENYCLDIMIDYDDGVNYLVTDLREKERVRFFSSNKLEEIVQFVKTIQ